MKAALKNDSYFLRYLLPIILLISILSAVTYTITPDEGLFSLATPLLYTSFIPIALYLINERSKWDGFFAGLPGKRFDYIHAKYIAAFLSVIFVMAVLVICYILKVFVTGQNEMNKQIPVLLIGFSVSVFLCSLFLPIMTRFGARAGVVIFFIMMFLCGIISGYYEAMVEEGEAAVPDLLFTLPVVGAAIMIYLLSWLISLQIYKHKEL